MKNYWNSLNHREKAMVALAAITVMVYLFYLLVYSPLKTSLNTKTHQLIEKTDTLKWMQKARLQERSSHAREAISNGQLLTLIANQLKEGPLKRFPNQLQQTSNGEIQLNFNEVPFNQCLKWLEKIHQNYAVTIKQLNAEKTQTSGLVKLSIILSAGS